MTENENLPETQIALKSTFDLSDTPLLELVRLLILSLSVGNASCIYQEIESRFCVTDGLHDILKNNQAETRVKAEALSLMVEAFERENLQMYRKVRNVEIALEAMLINIKSTAHEEYNENH